MAFGLLETVLMVILAIIFPPLPVLLETGCGGTLLLNVVLTICGWLPGVVHAIYVSVVNPLPATAMGLGGPAARPVIV
jgi:uncharacterized membrane protein YqaE (UPF0057 family)